MSDKEMNIAILEGLKQIANEIFSNEINIVPGTYTAAELAKEKSAKGDVIEINYIQTNNGGLFLNANYKAVVFTDKNESLCFTMPAGTGKDGFHPVDFYFDRSNMVSLLDFGKKAVTEPIKEEETPKENHIAPVQSEPINLPIAVSEYKYNILGLYCLLSLVCDVCRAIIYNEVNEVLKRLKMLLASPVVNIEDFVNELQIIDLQPGEVEEIKDVQPGAGALPYENQSFAVVPDIAPPPLSRADVPGVPSACVPLLDAVSFALWFAVRSWVVSARGTVPAPAANIGCSRRESVRIRGATSRTTASAERLKNKLITV